MKKENAIFLLTIFILLALMPACEALMEECERNSTGTFYVENQSESGRAYKVIIDGINYGIVGAGSTKEWTLSAGSHIVQILFADTDHTACSTSAPTVVKCQKNGLICRS
jgi:hypothetical protein